MRKPTAWDDKTLLEDEPFRSRFHAFSAADTNRRNTNTIRQSLDLMATELGKDEEDAALEWVRLAFVSSPNESRNQKVVLDNETRVVFVRVYWELYKQREPGGGVGPVQHLLSTERSKRGFDYPPPHPSDAANKQQVAVRHLQGKSTRISKGKVSRKKDMNRGAKIQQRPGFEGSKTQNVSKQRTKGATSGRVRRTTAPPAIKIQSPPPSDATKRQNPASRGEFAGCRDNAFRRKSLMTTGEQSSGYTLSIDVPPLQGIDPVSPLVISQQEVDVKNTTSPIHLMGATLLINSSPQTSTNVQSHHLERSVLPQKIAASVQKPPLPEYPPIWAQSRQEICESLDWFRSYQGGVYHVHDFVKGYLLSAFSSSRDLFEHDGHLIISHGGGKAESIHTRRGQSSIQPAKDQRAEDKSVRALLANYRESRPLVLLIDDKYALFPYDIGAKGITYAVLGFYTITHAWAEYQPTKNLHGRVVRYKFAFQWCAGQGAPWWLSYKHKKETLQTASLPPHDTLTTPPTSPSTRPVKVKQRILLGKTHRGVYCLCSFCRQETPKVYEQAWACLNPSCSHFWITCDGVYLTTSDLNYDANFLHSSVSYLLPPKLRDLCATLRVPVPGYINTTYASTRGIHCRKCGRLSCRSRWERWECLHCKQTVEFPAKLQDAEEFWNEKLPVPFVNHFVHKNSGIVMEAFKFFPYGNGMGQVRTFVLPNKSGRIHHIQPTSIGENNKADMIFKEYQSLAMDSFRRWPLRAHKCRGPLLTNYFSQNSGEPYHYVGGTANTIPFDHASTAVRKARDLIQICIQRALNMNSDFNEVLSAAYMERQRMAFHSDSEEGLGPLVAGLSLGSPAVMHFRVHSKYTKGKSGNKSSIVLSVVLRHGDVLVMDGAEVQEYYEHTVVPSNFRIAATARRIDATKNRTSTIS